MDFGGSRKIKKCKMADTRWRLLLLRNDDVINLMSLNSKEIYLYVLYNFYVSLPSHFILFKLQKKGGLRAPQSNDRFEWL